MSRDEPPDDPGVSLPNSYAAPVMRHAVLVPLRGKLVNRAAIVRAATSVRASWRGRIKALGELGWEPGLGEERWPLVYCRRPFTLPDPGGRFCGYRTICPHCWARQVLEVWRRVDHALFPGPEPVPDPRVTGRMPTRLVRGLEFEDGPNRRTQFARLMDQALFERVVEYEIPFAGWIARYGPEARALSFWLQARLKPGVLATGPGTLQNRPAELRRFAALGCSGILDVTRPLLTASGDRDAGPAGWTMQVRQVFTVPVAKVAAVAGNWRVAGEPPPFHHVPGTVKLTRHDRPSRRRVMTAVARAMAYPRMLLHGPAGLALEVIRTREPHRLIGTGGSFYGTSRGPEG
jgi:hypothetical protein